MPRAAAIVCRCYPAARRASVWASLADLLTPERLSAFLGVRVTTAPGQRGAIAAADYAPLLAWLRANIHAHGSTFDPSDLIQQATGKKASSEDYIKHLTQRYL